MSGSCGKFLKGYIIVHTVNLHNMLEFGPVGKIRPGRKTCVTQQLVIAI